MTAAVIGPGAFRSALLWHRLQSPASNGACEETAFSLAGRGDRPFLRRLGTGGPLFSFGGAAAPNDRNATSRMTTPTTVFLADPDMGR